MRLGRFLFIALFAFCLINSINAQAKQKRKLFPGDTGYSKFDSKTIDDEIERLKNTEFKNEYKQIEEHRNKAWSCYYLVKQKAVSIVPTLEEIAGSKADMFDVQKLVVADMFSKCLARMTSGEGKEFLHKLGHDEPMNMTQYETLLTFNQTKYKDPEQRKLSETQRLMLKYFEDLDDQVRKMNGDDETNENFFYNGINVTPGIAGFSLKDMSTSTKIISFLACLGALSFFFHFAYKKLFAPKESALEKAKKTKQEKKGKNKKEN